MAVGLRFGVFGVAVGMFGGFFPQYGIMFTIEQAAEPAGKKQFRR